MSSTRAIHVSLAALMLLLLAGLALASIAWAGSSDGPSVDWQVLGSCGAPVESSSGTIVLNGTLGQTAIGSSAAIHGSLGAGFWYGLGKGIYTVYLPLVLRNPH